MNHHKILLSFYALLFLCLNGYSVAIIESDNDSKCRLIGESIYVHTDRDIYAAGENIYFKIYLLNNLQQEAFENSRIVYLVIRNSNQKRIFESRVWLENNSGYGRIYIPDTLSTGFYQIIAFTNWMKGGFEQSQFTKEIFITNRFDEAISEELNEPTYRDSLANKLDIDYCNGYFSADSSYSLELRIAETKHSPRSKVVLNTLFKSNNQGDSIADVSIAVTEVNSLFNHGTNSIKSAYCFSADEVNRSEKCINYRCIETKGVIVSGRVIDFVDVGIPNQMIFLSTPDTVVNLQYVVTDSNGAFQFMLNNYYEGKILFVGLLNNHNAENCRIVMDDKYNCSKPFNPTEYINTGRAHYLKKLQTIATVNKSFEVDFSKDIATNYSYFYCPQLYSVPDYRVYTSDFLYLNQLDAILSETLYGVKLNSQNRNSVSIFDPLFNQTYSNSFVFLDGVPFFYLSDIIGYGSDKVKRIETVNSPWVLGDFLFKGILSIFTYNQEIDNFKDEMGLVVIPAGQYLPRTQFLSPNYSADEQRNRTPDFRQLLYWNPLVRLKSDQELELNFFTGDLCSDYLVKVEGVSSKGIPLSVCIIIKVIND
ncbi:hypothetical protein CYCD_02760 [Tenuifilaceae bacterium CYCD]|nr:hypothetical protein CYCD_02760 [Tenuifilaceae bacterium CYCD]